MTNMDNIDEYLKQPHTVLHHLVLLLNGLQDVSATYARKEAALQNEYGERIQRLERQLREIDRLLKSIDRRAATKKYKRKR